jgi:hypothetical protein
MSQTVTLQSLDDKLNRLEAEIENMREELVELRQQKTTVSQDTLPASRLQLVDKAAIRRALDAAFGPLDGEPLDVEGLQRRISELGLEPNEFSRGLIEMREE